MDRRTALNKNDCLAFPGLECVIDAPAGRGSSVLAYTGYYPDREDPRIRHRVLIRELFPYDPSGGILRSKENALEIEKQSEVLFAHYRESFLRANEVHSRMAEEIPGELDLHINTFTCNNTLYSVMGYTGGRSLEEEIRRLHGREVTTRGNGALDIQELELLRCLKIIRGALQVLRAFHETKYLHLDISPDNILLIGSGDRERVTLIDYNSVHTLSEIRSDSSAFLSMKDGYTAPEVRLGQRAYIGPQSDLFSMTAVFWHCLSGRKLSDLEQIGSVFPDPSGLPGWENLPASARSMLRLIFRKGLSPSPRKRYGSTAEMLADLGELEDRINGRGITRWALWENGRARCLRLMRDNVSLQYIRDDSRIYPLHVEKADGSRTELFDLFGISGSAGSPYAFFDTNRPLLLLGGGGTGKTTALFRLCYTACGPDPRKAEYREDAAAVFYISLYGYRNSSSHFIRDTLLEGLQFKPETDSMETARRELLQLLDNSGSSKGSSEHSSRASSRVSSRPVLQLLLDGFNEASGDTGPLLEEIRLLASLSGVRILMTSRSDPGEPLFEKITLCRLDPVDIRRILSGEGILPPENMEIFDLLGFPILLSIYIQAVKSRETNPGSLQSREQLLREYFDGLRNKEISALPQNSPEAAGIDAVFQYLLPEAAAQIHRAGHAVTDTELMNTVQKCYRELSGRALTAIYPRWIGHTGALRLGAENADEWYGRSVLDILHRRAGLLVRDEQGRLRILHQIMEEYLEEKSRQFHLQFDRVKRRQKLTLGFAAAAAGFFLVTLFGIYNFRMRRQIEEKHRQMLLSETEMLIVESVRNSEEALANEDRREAVDEAVDAVLLSYADLEQTERVVLEEDGFDQLRNDLPLIRERIRERISQDQTRQGQESTKAFSLPRQAGAAPAIDDSYYPALAQKALTDALGIYVFSDENTDENRPPASDENSDENRPPALSGMETEFLSYDPAYPHTETRVNPNQKTVLLYSAGGFRIMSVQNGDILCDLQLADQDSVLRTEYLRNSGASCLKAVWPDGTVRCYDASNGRLIPQSEAEDLYFTGNTDSDETKETVYDIDMDMGFAAAEDTHSDKADHSDKANNSDKADTTYTETASARDSHNREYLTDKYRLQIIPGGIVIFDITTGDNLGELDVDADVSFISRTGDDLLIGCFVPEDGSRFALLLNKNFETLAELPDLCDLLDGALFFDNGDGSIRKTPVYTLPELLDAASGL